MPLPDNQFVTKGLSAASGTMFVFLIALAILSNRIILLGRQRVKLAITLT